MPVRLYDLMSHAELQAQAENETPDLTAVIWRAQQLSRGQTPVVFHAGRYTISAPIPSQYCNAVAWEGERTERGTNALALSGGEYQAVQIVYRPGATSQPLFAAFSVNPSLFSTVGPFSFQDLTFDLGAANGLRFGERDPNGDGVPDAVGDGVGQRYVVGPRVVRCAFEHTRPSLVQTGTITRSGRVSIDLTWAFEAVIEDCSFVGGDYHVRTWGCDRPAITRVRSQGAWQPFDFDGASTAYSLHGVQVEGWGLGAIRANGVFVTASDLRLEQNDGAPAGSGRYALAETFAVTAGSGTLTASATMAGKLIPGVSLLELSSGGNRDTVLVTAVNGTSVTVDTTGFVFLWSAAAASAVRIHGYGILQSGAGTVALNGASISASVDVPAIVWVVNSVGMSVTNAHAQLGLAGNNAALVVGNHPAGQSGMAATLQMSACSNEIVADPSHPLVDIGGTPWREPVNANYRRTVPDPRPGVWFYSPKTYATSNNNGHLVPLVRVAGEPGTTQRVWAWRLLGANPATGGDLRALYVYDSTLPSTAGTYRFKVRCRTLSGSGTVTLVAGGDGAPTAPLQQAMTTAWQTLTADVSLPAPWATPGRTENTSVQLVIAADVDAEVEYAGVERL